MPSREVPRDFEVDNDPELGDIEPDTTFVGHAEYRPINAYDALMRCEPFQEPDVSREERLEMRDVIADAIDGLTEKQRWIFEALFCRRSSLRRLAAEVQIPKTTLARRRDELLEVLREKLIVNPMIERYLDTQ